MSKTEIVLDLDDYLPLRPDGYYSTGLEKAIADIIAKNTEPLVIYVKINYKFEMMGALQLGVKTPGLTPSCNAWEWDYIYLWNSLKTGGKYDHNKYNVKTNVVSDGVKFVLSIPDNRHKEVIANWYIKDAYVITNAELIIKSKYEINNPNAVIKHECKISALHWPSNSTCYGRPKRKNIKCEIIDDKFYYKGELINAINANAVLAELEIL